MKKVKIAVGLVLIILVGFGIMTVVSYIQGLLYHQPYFTQVSSTTVVQQLRDLNRLETASFTIEKIVDEGKTGNVFQQFLYGDRLLLIAHGQVIAGFDLSGMSARQITIQGSSIAVDLPAPSILLTTLDESQTRVYDRQTGILSKGDKNLESKARLAAQQVIQQAACQGGILDQSSVNARKQLTSLFRGLGFTAITITIPQGSCS